MEVTLAVDASQSMDSKGFADQVFFLYGWNKRPASAERNYRDFICRFHDKLDVP